MRQHLRLRLYSKRGRYEKNQHLSYMQSANDFRFIISACADAVTTGGVTAVVTPRPVDSLGNEKQVEFATSAKAETTTTETTTKPAYNQEEMKKDLEDLGKEDMAASAVGIFA